MDKALKVVIGAVGVAATTFAAWITGKKISDHHESKRRKSVILEEMLRNEKLKRK